MWRLPVIWTWATPSRRHTDHYHGGSLTCGAASWTVIGDSYNALMDVETGGSVSIQNLLYIGVGPGAEGTLIMNGGTVSVAFGLYLGYQAEQAPWRFMAAP